MIFKLLSCHRLGYCYNSNYTSELNYASIFYELSQHILAFSQIFTTAPVDIKIYGIYFSLLLLNVTSHEHRRKHFKRDFTRWLLGVFIANNRIEMDALPKTNVVISDSAYRPVITSRRSVSNPACDNLPVGL